MTAQQEAEERYPYVSERKEVNEIIDREREAFIEGANWQSQQGWVSLPEHGKDLDAELLNRLSKLVKEAQLDINNKILAKCRAFLDDLFANRLVNGETIKQYELAVRYGTGVVIIPITPYLEESYDDEETDKIIHQWGEENKIELRWEYYVYHK